MNKIRKGEENAKKEKEIKCKTRPNLRMKRWVYVMEIHEKEKE